MMAQKYPFCSRKGFKIGLLWGKKGFMTRLYPRLTRFLPLIVGYLRCLLMASDIIRRRLAKHVLEAASEVFWC